MKRKIFLFILIFSIIQIFSIDIKTIINDEVNGSYKKAIKGWIQYYKESNEQIKQFVAVNRIYELCNDHNKAYFLTKKFLLDTNTPLTNYFLFYLLKNKEAQFSEEILNKLHIMRGFYVVGPLMYNDFDDLENIEKVRNEYVGKHFNIKEHYVKCNFPKIYLDSILNDQSYSKCRLRNNFYINKDNNYTFYCSFADAMSIYIDNKRIFKKNILNSQGSFLYKITLKLTKGVHKIVIYSGVESDNWYVQFSFDKRFKFITDNECKNKKPGKLLNYTISTIEPLKGNDFESVIINSLFYRYAKNFNSDIRKDYNTLDNYCEQHPFIWGYKFLATLEPDLNDSYYWYKKISKLNKELGNYLLAKLFDDSNKYKLGFSYLQQLSQKDERNYDLFVDYYSGLGLDKMLTKYYQTIKSLEWSKKKEEIIQRHILALSNTKDVELYINNLIKEYPYKKASYLSILKDFYKNSENMSKYKKLLEISQELYPFNLQLQLKYIHLLKDKDKIIKRFDELSKQFLYNKDLLKAQIDYYLSIGNVKKTEYFLKQYLKIDPQNSNILSLYSELKDTRSILDAFFEKNRIKIPKKPILPNFAKDSDLILLSKNELLAEENNGLITKKYEELYYINKYSGLNKINYLPIYYSNSSEYIKVESVRVIDKNGNIFPQFKGYSHPYSSYNSIVSDYQAHYFVFDNLDVGSMIYIKYSIIQYSNKSFRDQFPGDLEYIKQDIPILNYNLSLLYPKNKKLFFKLKHINIKPTYQIYKGNNVYTWHFTNLKAINYIPNMVPDIEVLPYLVFTNFNNWNGVYHWVFHLFKERFKANKIVEETYKSLHITKSMAFKEKVERIFKYVSQKIHYFGIEYGLNGYQPRFPSKVITDKYGDCKDKATLMKVLLNMAGIKANITLVRTSDTGRVKNPMPILTLFNHAILTVYDKNGFPYIVDPTVNYGLPWEMPRELIGSFAFEFNENGYRTKILTNNPNQNNYEQFYTKVIIDEYGANITRTVKKSGYFTFSSRRMLEEGDKKMKEELENFWQNYYPAASVLTIKHEKDIYTNIVKYTYSMFVKNFVNSELDELNPLLYDDHLYSNYGQLQTIDYPITFPLYNRDESIDIILKKGLFIKDSIPKDLFLDNKNFNVIIKYRLENDKILHVEWKLKTKKDRVKVHDYKQFKMALLKLKEAFEKRVKIKK